MDIYVERCEAICEGGGIDLSSGRKRWSRDTARQKGRRAARGSGTAHDAQANTRRGHAGQDDRGEARVAASDEYIGVAAVLDDGTTERAAGGEVKWHSS